MLRLPPYHCELNPIELVWAQIKKYVAKNNTTYKLPDVRHHLEEGIKCVISAHWKACVEHVKKAEDKLWELDNIIENMEEVTPLIVNLQDDSESSDESDLASELQ